MKKVILFTLLVLCFASYPVYGQNMSDDYTDISIPCIEDSFDDDKSVGAWGVGKSEDERFAMLLATQDAIESMARRFHVDSKEIDEFASSWCRMYTKNNEGEYVVYVSIILLLR